MRLLNSPIYQLIFRISPEEEEQNDAEKKANKRGKSAPEGKKKDTEGNRDSSPPDPLEPWSTKDLANINKLLDTDDN